MKFGNHKCYKCDETKKSSRVYNSLIDDYKRIIIEKVDTFGATAMAVYKFIIKKGYKGKYRTIAAFINKHKNIEIKKATVRFKTTPGLQAQVDWKENLTMISKHGEIFKVNIFLMVLGYSRIKYVKLTTDKELEYLKSLPPIDSLVSYISCEKEYKV